MYRRRRRQRGEIAFSFDSFLDVVANVCGIIIRLILVAWVGGRSYSALMQQQDDPTQPAATVRAEPKAEDDPLSSQIRQTQTELEGARARLLSQLQELGLAAQKRRALDGRLIALAQNRDALDQQRQDLTRTDGQTENGMRLAALSMEDLRRRQQALLEEIKQVESKPAPKKELRYRTPVSRSVQADEIFFECQNGRVTFIDLPAFLQEIQAGLEGKAEALRTSWKLEETTHTVGAFRLRYVIARNMSAADAFGDDAKPRNGSNFRFGLSEWSVEPMAPIRGETLESALAAGSDFRRVVDALDSTTVITFWVYSDSFGLYRQLRDYLYDRGLEVAGRPLTMGAPIAASRQGTASRGQ